MTWVAEANCPQAWTNHAISSIFWSQADAGWCCYVGGYNVQKFYKYNLTTDTWTELADPPAVLYAGLSLNPTNTKVCGHASNGTVLYIYTVSSNTWATSSGTPGSWGIQSHVWYDADTIWCNVRSLPNIKFYKYTPSDDTWYSYANSFAPATTFAPTTCISTDGARLYSGTNGQATHKYTIATDAYANGPSLAAAYYFVWTCDRHKLWFGPRRTTPVIHVTLTRWINPDTEVLEAAVFSEKNDANKASNMSGGIYTISQASYIAIANQMTSEPTLYSETLPTPSSCTTDAADNIEKEQADLNGTLDDDGGVACDCGFEWGETVAYGNTTPTQSRTTGQTFSQTITGLDPGKTYHFRAFATNPVGTSYGSDQTFNTLSAIVGGINPGMLDIMVPGN